jgi:hypothetical protein
MKNNGTWFLLSLALFGGCCTGLASAQNPDLQQKVADLKQSIAMNKQALAQYTWVEQVNIILKGEQKKQENFQVRLGPDGKPQKQSLDQPQEASGGHEGRLKQHVVEKKKEEYKEYADQMKSLIEQYVPPDKDLLDHARAQGDIMVGSQPGSEGQYRLLISNYVKKGDSMTIVFDKAQKRIVSLSIASYLSDPKDAVTATIAFSGIPGGPNHVSSQTINGVSKQLTISVQNSNYQKL